MVTEDDMTLHGGHVMQHKDHRNVYLKPKYVLLLTNVTPIHLIKKVTE